MEIPHFHFQGTSKKKVLDQPSGMIVQAELNITMPGRLCDWFVCFLVCFRSVHSLDLSCRTTPSCRGEPVQRRRLHLHRGQCGRPSWRPDHLRCFLLRPWARWPWDQGAPHDPQQVQEAEENWFRRDLGLSTPRHVQRSGKTIHPQEFFPDNCLFQSKIMFAWAKHAQPTELPNDVGFSLQPDEYLVLQVLASSSNFIFDPHLLPHCTRCTMQNLNKTTTADLLCWFGRQSQSTLQVTFI